MTKTERLLALLQLLRQHRYPVKGEALAAELGVSLRTVYRDVAALQAQGARIEGEAGVGYMLKPGFLLPPLMFSHEEIEALVLGMRWVAQRADAELAAAARSAHAKIGAVLPPDLKEGLDDAGLGIGPGQLPAGEAELPAIRRAIRLQRKLRIRYQDLKGAPSERTIWPFLLAFFDAARLVVGWCELRQDYRAFRADRIEALTLTDERYPRRRQAMLAEWRAQQGIKAADKI